MPLEQDLNGCLIKQVRLSEKFAPKVEEVWDTFMDTWHVPRGL